MVKKRKQKFVILNEKTIKLIEPDLESKVIKLIRDAKRIKTKNEIDLEYLIARPGKEEEDPLYIDWFNATTKLIKYCNNQIRYLVVKSDFPDWTPMSSAIEGYAELISILVHPTKYGALKQVKTIFYKKNADIIPIVDSRDLPNTWKKIDRE